MKNKLDHLCCQVYAIPYCHLVYYEHIALVHSDVNVGLQALDRQLNHRIVIGVVDRFLIRRVQRNFAEIDFQTWSFLWTHFSFVFHMNSHVQLFQDWNAFTHRPRQTTLLPSRTPHR